jgi:prolyl 4-hydroxylase
VIRGSLRDSTITNKSGALKHYRTSKTCDLSLLNHPLVNDIDQRICSTLGFNASYSEPIQAQWYNKNQEFKPHTDYFEPNSKEFDVHAKEHGQRTWTFMLYLNNTLAGGATQFTRVNKAFFPKRGRAVIWNSLTPEGKENIESMHCGTPVEDGFKVIITKWFRLKGNGKRYTKQPNEYLPCYTDEGLFKSKLPATLFKKIYKLYQSHTCKLSSNEHIFLNENLKQEVQHVLQPLVEAWFGHYLKLSQFEGIHSYKKGTVIAPHRQDSKTSIVCVLINIQQVVNQPWPLIINDHNYREHKLLLHPGDMVFYEAAKLKQGRPFALNGDKFADLNLHYALP